jgi:uncharacterized phage infection (PIP) family protein YhgE
MQQQTLATMLSRLKPLM